MPRPTSNDSAGYRLDPQRLKALRVERGASQRALAEASGVPYNTLLKLEQAHNLDCQISTAARLAMALGVTVDSLLEPHPTRRSATTSGKAPRLMLAQTRTRLNRIVKEAEEALELIGDGEED
jgi:transcriptional regulator with XRE-family HTH domain